MALIGWNPAKKYKLTIDSLLIAEQLTDFPLHIVLSSAAGQNSFDCSPVFADLGENSKKIAVEIGDTGIQCAIEIESWDGTAQEAHIHVRIPTIAADSDTELYLYYDSEHADNDSATLLSSVVLLIESDELAGSSTFIDKSASAHTVTVGGNTAHSVNQKKLSKSSIYFDGSDYLNIDYSTDFNFGTDAFTIDFWIFTNQTGNYPTIISRYDDELGIFLNNGKIFLYSLDKGGALISTGTVNDSAWHHVACVRSGDTAYIFVDGVLDVSQTGWSGYNISAADALRIGKDHNNAYFNGYLQGIRIHKGIAYWTAGFTPPDRLPSCGNVDDTGGLAAMLVWGYSGDHRLICLQAQDPSGAAPQMLDSTNYAGHGTSNGTMTSADLVAGPVGLALDYDGSDDYVDHGYQAAHAITDLTVSAIIVPSITLDSGMSNAVGIVSRRNDPVDAEATWALIINADGRLALLTAAGSIVGTRASWTAGTAYHVVATYDSTGPAAALWIDGVKETLTVNSPAAMSGSTNHLVVGKDADAGEFFPGKIDQVVVVGAVRSDAWLIADYYSVIDALTSYSSTAMISVTAVLEQMYGAGEVHAFLEQRCGLMLDAVLSQRYGDAAAPVAALYQYYGDTSLPAVALEQPYDDTLLSVRALEQEYHLMYDAVAGLVQEYAICEWLLSKALEQIYSLKDLDPVTRALVQAYGLLGDPARSPVCGIAVVADDQAVDPWQVEVSHDLGSYISKCTVHLRSHGQWQSIQRLGDLQVYDGTITYHYFIESKPRARTRSGAGQYEADYQLIGLSKTAALDAPYAVPVTMEWASGGMASAIAEDLIDLAGMGLALDWRIVDWFIGPDLFFLTDETPLSGLRRLIADRGVLQTDVDGVTLIVKREDEVSPASYAAATATYTLTDEYDFTTAGDQPEIHPLYNSVLISDQLASTSAGFRIESDAVSAIEAMVKVYRTPWGGTWTLRTSGGAWVTIEDLGVVTETITEQVEFVDGVGRAGYPVYAQVSLSWLQTSLGGVIFSEDGQLVSGTAGNSLAEFAYTTKYRKYRVKSDRVEAVQFYVEEL